MFTQTALGKSRDSNGPTSACGPATVCKHARILQRNSPTCDFLMSESSFALLTDSSEANFELTCSLRLERTWRCCLKFKITNFHKKKYRKIQDACAQNTDFYQIIDFQLLIKSQNRFELLDNVYLSYQKCVKLFKNILSCGVLRQSLVSGGPSQKSLFFGGVKKKAPQSLFLIFSHVQEVVWPQD